MEAHFNFSGTLQQQRQQLMAGVQGLIAGETNVIANLSNVSALLSLFFDRCNWIGFYLVDPGSGELVVGPFQGKPACVRIPLGKGVCGLAAQELQTQCVADVLQFPGHIACDPASRSELVVPIVSPTTGDLHGVLDMDSPEVGRFGAEEIKSAERVVSILANSWTAWS